MPDIVTLQSIDRVGVIVIDHPPVNTLSMVVRTKLADCLRRAVASSEIDAILISCAGRTFFAGADIAEFGKPIAEPSVPALVADLDGSPKPVVAAIHGTALGGGFELALACSYRIAAESARVGLPEVRLGILPGAGGTQRLPRIVGAQRALEIMTSGRQVGMAEALETGLVDAIVAEDMLLDEAIRFARAIAQKGVRRVSDQDCWTLRDRADPAMFRRFLEANAKRFRGFKAPAAIVAAIEAAVNRPFDEGLTLEASLCGDLIDSPESAAQRAYFFAERDAAKAPGISKHAGARPIGSVAIVGAGTMGAGIAIAALNADLPVALVETAQPALDRGVAQIRTAIEAMVARGRLDEATAAARLASLTPGLGMAAAADADLVIEAVYEDLDLKKEIFAELDRIAKPGAILASNTSFLDIDAIAAVTARPGSVVGLHFFSPAHVMRLLEIVRCARTDPQVVASAFAFARALGKVGVLSGVCDGFIAHRLMLPRALQAEAMALEGTPVADIDRVLVDYGFAMGHFQMVDLAGLDAVARASKRRTAATDLVAMGRLGQKSGGGYYDYDEQRRPMASNLVTRTIAQVAGELGIAPRPTVGDAAILDRLLVPVMDEGRKILAEGVALRASDIDVVAVLGHDWPVYRGGPMFEAGRIGADELASKLRRIEGR